MPAPPRSAYQYCVLRVVPHVERGEFLNAGVVVFCRQLRFLDARVALDDARLLALAPDVDPAPIRRQLDELVRIAGGRSEEHTSELQSRQSLVCRLLLEEQI